MTPNKNNNLKNIINLFQELLKPTNDSSFLNTLPPIDTIEQNNKLCEMVKTLSKNPLNKEAEFENINNEFKTIYLINNFRHLYSEIEQVVLDIAKNTNSQNSETLKENIKNLYRYILKNKNANENNDDVNETLYISCIYKLYDHISLGLNRAFYTRNIIDTYETENQSKIDVLNNLSSQLKIDIGTTKNDIDDIKKETVKEIEKSKNETISHYVSILGIFAGIILAFFGGINLFVGMFSNYEPQYLFSYTFFSIVMGIILFDTIAVLMYVVAHISGKGNIFSKDNGIRKLFKYLNIFFGILAVAMFIAA